MSDFNDYGSNKSALVLEGAYKGIVAKIEEARERICRELDTGVQQDLSSYESIMEGLRQGIESILSEFRFVSQQNSAIYEFQEETRKGAQSEMMNFVNSKLDSIVSTLNAVQKKDDASDDKRSDELSNELAQRFDALTEALKAQFQTLSESVNTRADGVIEELSNRLNDAVGSILVSVGNRIDGAVDAIAERFNGRFESFSEDYNERLYSSKEDIIRVIRDSFADLPAPAAPQEIDYEYLADRVVSRMATAIPAPQEIDYEYLADRVASRMTVAVPAPQEIDYEYLAERVAAKIAPAENTAQPAVQTVRQEVDYDLLAAKLSERIKIPAKEENGSTPIVMFDSQPQPTEQFTESESGGFSEESFDYDVLAEKIASILPETDYDMIAEKVAAIIPEVDYDAIYEHVANAIPQTDYDAVADKVASCIPLTDYDLIAERVAEQIGMGGKNTEEDAAAEERRTTEKEVLIEAITENVTDALTRQFDVSVDEEGVRKFADAVGQTIDYDALAQKVADLIRGDETDLFRIASETAADYRVEAKASRIIEPIYEEDSEDKSGEDSQPAEIDYNAIVERVVEMLREEEEERARAAELKRLEEEKELAEQEREKEEERARNEERKRLEDELAREAERARLAEERAQEAERIREEEERMREEDRSRLQEELAQIAERVRLAEERAAEAERIRQEEELARQEAERIRQEELARQEEEERLRKEEEERLRKEEEERLRREEEERRLREEEEQRRLAEMVPVEPELTEVAEPDEKEAENELAAALAIREEDDEDETVVESSDDPTKTIRYKRSFLAKIIQSDEDTKKYYGELKNELLSYEKVHSQISWSNDRITKGRETIAKIGIRGKTLCVYLALDPDEFPITVYHQDYAGDTKMYEKTPLMMQIKSHVALKRTIKLIGIMMSKGGTEKLESFQPVDYIEMYGYRSDEALLDEGLIKTSMMKKVDFNF